MLETEFAKAESVKKILRRLQLTNIAQLNLTVAAVLNSTIRHSFTFLLDGKNWVYTGRRPASQAGK